MHENCAEEWRDVVGFEGFYLVSSCGRVKTVARRAERVRRGFVDSVPVRERILAQAVHPTGRLYVNMHANDQRARTYTVHRIVIEAFIGPQPDGMECLHRDGDCTNNHVTNLMWGTHAENMRDMVRHGTSARGERSHNARLTEADVRTIRERRAAGETTVELSVRYGVAPCTISQICTGKTWGHLELEKPIRRQYLTDEDVVAIRGMRAAGAKLREIADRFKISIPHASTICSHKRRH